MERSLSGGDLNPFSALGLWVSKSLRGLSCGPRWPNGFCSKGGNFDGLILSNNAVFCDSPTLFEERAAVMEGEIEKSSEVMEEKKDGFGRFGSEVESFADLGDEERRQSSFGSEFLTSDLTGKDDDQSHSSSESCSSSHSVCWPIEKEEPTKCDYSNAGESPDEPQVDDQKVEKQGSSISEIEMMKERFCKLLLGEDMSGSGNGVCTALAISNAITNLCATMFGQIWRLEPLPSEKKSMWRREMQCLLCVSDHIVELMPSWQTFADGSKVEVMTCRPRSDLYVNLPALRKLDNMLLEILDSFQNTEFWYVDQGIIAPDADGSASFRGSSQRQEEKWWLPVPRVPPCGLHENSRKHLQHKRDCTNQILKAAMAINGITLAEIQVPESYLEALPKNARACLGDLIHRYITSDQFYPECLLACLDLSSEHQALEIANRVEASVYFWRRRNVSKPTHGTLRSASRSSWEMVKDLMVDTEKRELFADRAESLLLCLKQRFPGLPQTTLDMSKIQYNKDVGKSILESYSRVLESLAFNIVARIDDLMYVDDMTRHSDQFTSISNVGVISGKSVTIPYAVPVTGTPYKTAYATPLFSPGQLRNSDRGDQSPLVDSSGGDPHHGVCVQKVLTDYLSIDTRGNARANQREGSDANMSRSEEAQVS